MINRRASCLLSEIERYRGVIILATNYPGVVDSAFLAEEYGFTVGQIRSILLRAAFTAANVGSDLGQELILQAAEDEILLVARKEIGFRE